MFDFDERENCGFVGSGKGQGSIWGGVKGQAVLGDDKFVGSGITILRKNRA